MYAVLFMLYGVPKNPLTDPGYKAYFSSALEMLKKRRPITSPHFFVGGGATDPSRDNLTEAGAAFQMLTQTLGVPASRVTSCPSGIDCREVFEGLKGSLRQYDQVEIFCAYTHQDLVQFYAWLFLGNRATVTPIAFPKRLASDSPKAQLIRLGRIFRAFLGIAGVCFTPVRWLELALRRRHMRNMASHPQRLAAKASS